MSGNGQESQGSRSVEIGSARVVLADAQCKVQLLRTRCDECAIGHYDEFARPFAQRRSDAQIGTYTGRLAGG
jgi:hypothetical protein